MVGNNLHHVICRHAEEQVVRAEEQILHRLGIQCRGRYALLRYGVELVILIHGYNASLTKGRVEIGHIQNNADVAIPQNRAPRDAAALDVEAV